MKKVRMGGLARQGPNLVVPTDRRRCKEDPRSVTSSNDTLAASQGTQSVNSSGTGIAENHDTPGASRPRNNSGIGPAKKPAKRAASGQKKGTYVKKAKEPHSSNGSSQVSEVHRSSQRSQAAQSSQAVAKSKVGRPSKVIAPFKSPIPKTFAASPTTRSKSLGIRTRGSFKKS